MSLPVSLAFPKPETLPVKIPRRVALRRQLRTYRTRARVSARQGINKIVQLLSTVPLVGINELHTAHQKDFDAGVVKQIPQACCYGSVGGNVLFWRRPQRA